MNNDNPYSDIIEIMKGVAVNNQPPTIGIGEVISTSPLKILYNGIVLEEPELWVNDYLLTDHSRTAKGKLNSETQPESGGDGYALFASHTHKIANPYTDTIIYTDTDLKVGFRVAIFPLQDSVDKSKQQYMVLCHLRRPDGKYS